jgi:hypothetical protein
VNDTPLAARDVDDLPCVCTDDVVLVGLSLITAGSEVNLVRKEERKIFCSLIPRGGVGCSDGCLPLLWVKSIRDRTTKDSSILCLLGSPERFVKVSLGRLVLVSRDTLEHTFELWMGVTSQGIGGRLLPGVFWGKTVLIAFKVYCQSSVKMKALT